MSDLISRKTLIETIGKLKVDYYVDMHGKHNPIEQATKIINCIEDAPTVEAVPVVRGKWINEYINRYGHPYHCCSVCGFKASYQDKNFCPDCGADMRKKV